MKQGFATGTILALGLCAALVSAGEEEADVKRTIAAEDLVVTASRDWQSARTAAANVTVLSGDDLRRGAYGSVADALRHLAGVHVRSTTGNPVGAEVGMRGFGENSHGRVLVLLDGRRLNRPDMATVNWLQVSLGQIERVEVLRGGASALYGDHALAGVIHIVTRDGRRDPVREIGVEAGSFGSRRFQAGVFGDQRGWSYAATADGQESDGYRDRTGFRSRGGSLRLGYELLPLSEITVGAAWRAVDFEMPGGLTRAQMREDRKRSFNPADEARNEFWNTQADWRMEIGGGQLTALASFDRQAIESDMASWMSYTDHAVDTISGSLAYSVEHRGRNEVDNAFAAGLDYSRDAMAVDRYEDIQRRMRGVSAEIEKRALGVYARNATTLQESWVLSAGGRYETAAFEGEADLAGVPLFDDRDDHRALAGDTALVRKLGEASKLFVKAGSLYRYPFVDEQISYAGFGMDGFYSDLDPERGWSAEAGGRWEEGGLAGELSFFHVAMRDEIAWNPVSLRNENLEKTRRQGVEAGVRYAFLDGRLRLNGRYAYTEAKFADGPNDGRRLPLVPTQKATVTTEVALPAGFRLMAVSTYTGSSRLGGDYDNTQERLASHVVVDATLRHVSTWIPGLETYVAVDNALDETYAELGYAGWAENAYYPAPGRGFRVGSNWRF